VDSAASEPVAERSERAPRHLIATLVVAGVTLALLWPLVSSRRTLPNGDLLAHAWGLAWVDRQLARDPLRLYEANIYYPERSSLRLTESLVPQALMVWPLAALGADPILLVNTATLLSFALNALCAYALAFHLSRSFGGALFAGLAYAFCAYRLGHLVHVGVLSTQWFPLILLLAWRQLQAPRATRVLVLAAVLWAQVLSSGYYAYPAGALLVLGALVAGRRSWSVAGLGGLAASALLAAAAAYPFVAPYLQLAGSATPRSLAAIVHWSTRPASFLTAASSAGWLPHLALLERLGGEREALYAGTPALLLAAVGLAAAPRSRQTLALVVIGAGAAALSLGPVVRIGGLELPGPYELVRLLPLGDLMRVPARLAVLFLLAVCTLAALGWRAVERGGGRLGPPLLAACVALWLAESSPRGALAAVRDIERDPAFAAWLAAAEPGPVFELPYRGEGRHGIYVYWSTKHWRPLVNGHGTFRAPAAVRLALAGRAWPSPGSLRALREAGVRYVVVHDALAGSEERERYRRALDRPPSGAALRFRSNGDSVFEIASH
jgi:hypothetical protein